MRTVPAKPCKKCGDDGMADGECSWCGGHGLVHGYDGEPNDCRRCGNSGSQYPPRCPTCSAFRAVDTDELERRWRIIIATEKEER